MPRRSVYVAIYIQISIIMHTTGATYYTYRKCYICLLHGLQTNSSRYSVREWKNGEEYSSQRICNDLMADVYVHTLACTHVAYRVAQRVEYQRIVDKYADSLSDHNAVNMQQHCH